MAWYPKLAAPSVRRGLLAGTSVAALVIAAPVLADVTSIVASTPGTITPGATLLSNAGIEKVVTTTNISSNGSVGFNRFTSFTVGTNDLVTLVLPGAAKALVNVVDAQAIINGTVTSRFSSATGNVGGALYFVTPSGLVMGSSGRINTGQLIIRGGPAVDGLLDSGTGLVSNNAGALVSASTATADVTLGGTISAPGGIDVRAKSLTVLAGAMIHSGSAAAADFKALSLVSTDGIREGTHIVGGDGSIRIVADGAVTMADSATTEVSARPLDYLTDDGLTKKTTAGGIMISAGDAVTLRGVITAWDGIAAKAGDVTVATSMDKTSGIAAFVGMPTASASIDTTAMISGGAVKLTATATASTDSDTYNPARLAVASLGRLATNALLSNALNLGLDAYASIVDSSTNVDIGGKITAQGDLTIAATTVAAGRAIARAKVVGDANAPKFAVAGAYSGLTANAEITVTGAALSAGGILNLSATNDTRSTVGVTAVSEKNAVSAAVAINDILAAAKVNVDALASLSGDSVTVNASNSQSKKGFETSASAISKDGGAGGGAASVALENVSATLTIAGTVTAATTASFTTATTTERNLNTASMSVSTGLITDLKSLPTTSDGVAADITGAIGTAALKKFKLKGAASNGDDSTTNVGAAVAVAIETQSATTSVTGIVTAANGAVKIDSNVDDKLGRNNAAATVGAKPGASVTTTVAGAVAYADIGYTASSLAGGQLTAGQLDVTSKVNRPINTEYATSTGSAATDLSFLDFLGSFKDKISGTFGVEKGLFASAAGATAQASANDSTAISGSVSYNKITSTSQAQIANDSKLVLGGPLTVRAISDIEALNLGGAAPNFMNIVKGKIGDVSQGDAAGGAVGYFELNPTTLASIGNNVGLTRADGVGAVDATVDAEATLRALTLTPLSASGGGGTFSGTFALNFVDGTTHATIGAGTSLALGAGALDLRAATDLNLWAVAGSLATGGGGSSGSVGSVGVSGAVNKVDFSTTADFTAAAATPRTAITARDVQVDAKSSGEVNALSVAGVANKTAGGAPKPDTKSSFGTKLKFGVGLLAGIANDKLGNALKTSAAKGDAEAQAAKVKDAGGVSGAPATKSFGAAGSASVNIAAIDTHIGVKSVDFTHTPATVGSFRATAADAVDMMSLTGGAVLTYGPPASGGSTQIAGAYGLSQSDNFVDTAFDEVTLTNFDSAALEAITNGTRIGAGLSLGVDTTDTTSGGTAAASVSQLLASDGASATFDNGSITHSGPSYAGAVSILAYDGLTLGAGAGGLAFTKGSAFGGAVTVIEVDKHGAEVDKPGDDAAAAKLSNSTVTGYDSLSLSALNASLVGSVAVAGAATSGDNGAGSVAINVNIIDADTTASIDLGTSGSKTIDVSGSLKVLSGDVADTVDSRISSAGRVLDKTGVPVTTAGSSISSDYAFDATKLNNGAAVDSNVTAPTGLKVGSQIYALAVPLALSVSGNSGAIALSWNRIDDDRTAKITGSGATDATLTSIQAGSVTVDATDLSKIVALAAGVGVAANNSLLGSAAINSITGTASATVGSSPDAAKNLQVAVSGAANNFAVEATGTGGIWSFAGAIGAAATSAGGFALGLNEITRDDAAPVPGVAVKKAGLIADVSNVDLAGTPDVKITAKSTSTIESTAVAAAITGGTGVVGAATINALKPTISATASGLTTQPAAGRDLSITASDASTINSRAVFLTVAAGGAVVGGAYAGGIALNDIQADITASLTMDSGILDVSDLVIDAKSTATTTTFGAGAAAASGTTSKSLAGSVAINQTSTDAKALLSLTGGAITATGSVDVIATRDSTIDAFAGALAAGANALGASIVVNDVAGGASAKIVGVANSGATLTASANDPVVAAIRTGAATPAPDAGDAGLSKLKDISAIVADNVASRLKTADLHGVVVSAVSTHTSRTLAITGAAAKDAALAATAVVTNVGGTTTASVENANIIVDHAGKATTSTAQLGVSVDAGTHVAGASFAGAIAGAGDFAGAAPIVSDGYSSTTAASISGGSIHTTGSVDVESHASQAATALALAAGISGNVAATVSAVAPRFSATTTALIDSPNTLVALGADGVAINATSQATANALFVSLAVSGNVAVAGGIVVATNANTTKADYVGTSGSNGLGDVAVVAPKFSVTADGGYSATVLGAVAAGSGSAAVAGNVIGVIHSGTIEARADSLDYGDATDHGSLTIKANETVGINTKIAAAALAVSPVSAGITIGAQFILAQGKVDATLNRPTVSQDVVDVEATGTTKVDTLQAGLAVGSYGGGANVTYIGVGKVADADTATLRTSSTNSDKDATLATAAGGTANGNVNANALASGDLDPTHGSTKAETAAGAAGISTTDSRRIATGAAGTTNADGTAVASSTGGFGQVKNASDGAADRVRAQITSVDSTGTSVIAGSHVDTNALTIQSDAELTTTSTNVQITGGLDAVGATIGITRNAANSFALIGDGVTANGYGLQQVVTPPADGKPGTAVFTPATVTVHAITGGDAAKIKTIAGTAGVVAITVAVADAKLATITKAESTGRLLGFGAVKVAADDTATVSTSSIGIAAGAAVATIVVSSSDKTSLVEANLAGFGSGQQVTANHIDIDANAGGSTSASAVAGSGGLLFSGNAAVALATDERKVVAQIAENTRLGADLLDVEATVTPQVSATSFGIAASGVAAVGASVATAHASGSVSAAIGERSEIDTGEVTTCVTPVCRPEITVSALVLKPTGADNVYADATGTAGGAFVAINGSVALATLDVTTDATLGANLDGSKSGVDAPLKIVAMTTVTTIGSTDIVTLYPGADVTVEASRTTSQYATSSGVTVGSLALGAQYAEADSSGSTSASLLNVDTSAGQLGAVSVTSASDDFNHAKTVAGAGGLGVGVASIATTNTGGTVTTTVAPPQLTVLTAPLVVGGPATTTTVAGLAAASFTATAAAKAGFNAESNSTYATLVGGSGTTSTDTVTTAANVVIGAATPGAARGTNSRIDAGSFTIGASNTVAAAGGSANGAGGGVLTGSAALVSTAVTQLATTTINDGVTLRQYGGALADNVRQTFIDASISTGVQDNVQLTTGGAMLFPFARIDAGFTPTATVNIGKNVLIRGDSGIGIGTTIDQTINETGKSQVYGLAGVGGVSNNASTTSIGLISVGDNATIESMDDIRISAGTSSDSLRQDKLAVQTQTDVFNWTLLPLSTDANAHSTANGTNQLVLGAATIRSARDLIIEAESPTLAATASGKGHNPYLEIAHTDSDGGHVDQSGSGAIALNGTQLTAGYLAKRTIDLTGDTPGSFTPDIHNLDTDPDRLGRFSVATDNVDVFGRIQTQIDNLTKDPSLAGVDISTPDKLAAAALVNTAAADIAQLKETRNAINTNLGNKPNFDGVPFAGDAKPNLNGVRVAGVFAAGGEIVFGTDTVTASGGAVVTANGAPTITINNLSANNLILGQLYIPFKPGGAVEYVGKVNAAKLADKLGANLHTATEGSSSDGQIIITSGSLTTATVADVIADAPADAITSNLGGLFKTTVYNGNFVQFGGVEAGVYSVSVPNGLYAAPSTGGVVDLGNPIHFFYGFEGITLSSTSGVTGDGTIAVPILPSGFVPLTAPDAGDYIANYLAEKNDPAKNGVHLDPAAQATAGTDAITAFAVGPSYHRPYVTGSFVNPSDPLVSHPAVSDADGHVLNVYGVVRQTPVRDLAGNFTDTNLFTSTASRDSVIWGGCTGSCPYASDRGYPNAVGVGFSRNSGLDYQDGTGYTTGFLTPPIASKDLVPNVVSKSNQPTAYKGLDPFVPILTGSGADPITRTPAIRANQVLIDAKFVNISADIIAGPSKVRTLSIASTAKVIYDNVIALGTETFGQVLAGAAYDTAGDAGLNNAIAVNNFQSPIGRIDGAAQVATGNIIANFHKTGEAINGIAQGYIVVNPVAAGAGGSISITGRIINTNPLTGDAGSHLKVLNGYANISIDNNTGYDIHLSTLNAGASVDGRIKLVDTAANGAITTTLYTNAPGQQVTKDVAFFDGTKGDAAVIKPTVTLTGNQGLAGGTTLTYAPASQDVYYAYNETRSIRRTINDGGRFYNNDVTPWSWADGGARPNTSNAGFVDLAQVAPVTPILPSHPTFQQSADFAAATAAFNAATKDFETATALAKARNSGAPADFIQIVSGGLRTDLQAGTNSYETRVLSGGTYDPPHTFIIPTEAFIAVKTAVRANYGIGIVFDQGSNGGIHVNSNYGGNIVLGGKLTYGGGAVQLSAANSTISETATGSIYAGALDITARGSIGTAAVAATATAAAVAADPFRAAIATRTASGAGLGKVDVVSTGGDILLALTTASTFGGALDPITIDQVVAAKTVSITSDGRLAATDRTGLLQAGTPNDANIVGTSIALTAAGGIGVGPNAVNTSAAALTSRGLVIDVRDNVNPALTGSLSITAGGDVYVQTASHIVPGSTAIGPDTARTLRLGNIVSNGDVVIKAGGSIVAAKATATVDAVKLARFDAAADSLGLKPGDGCTGTCVVVDPKVRTAIDSDLRTQGKAAYVTYNLSTEASLARARVDAVGKLDAIAAFKTEAATAGVSIASDGTVTVTGTLSPNDPLYALALSALHAKHDLVAALAAYDPHYAAILSTATNEFVPLPGSADIARGLQLYYDGLRLPLATLFGTNPLPVFAATVTDQAKLTAISTGSAIPDTGALAWQSAQKTTASTLLTSLFGFVPSDAVALETVPILNFDGHLLGKTWSQSMLAFAVPSSAFVPVADTQFESRPPVISARGVTLIAGDSIGSFDAGQTFTFDKTGLAKNPGESPATFADRTLLAKGYLASSGPGDLTTTITYQKTSAGAYVLDAAGNKLVATVAFLTRRDQPLQLAATATVNAVAGAINNAPGITTSVKADGIDVAGNIFIDNVGALTIGTIISEKVALNPAAVQITGDHVSNPCADGTAALANCDSRIRLVADSLNSGFDALEVNNSSGALIAGTVSTVIGGLVRLEATSGSIGSSSLPVLLGARALETVRAGNDVYLSKLALRDPLYAAYGNDLIVGDAFAGGRLNLDNPYGSFYVGSLPSSLPTENRNARLVAGTLAMRAFGDIGSTSKTAAGLIGQFDITAPVIDILVAGYDFGSHTIRPIGPTDPTGSITFALRGKTEIGGFADSLLGARRSITIGYVPGFPSDIDVESPISVGEVVNLTSEGSIRFGLKADIAVLGSVASNGVLDLTRLNLNLLGAVNFSDMRSMLFKSLAANGGTIHSDGFIQLSGMLVGNGTSPITLDGNTGVSVGGVSGGAVALTSRFGDIALAAQSFVRDLTITANNVTTNGIVGTDAHLTANATGTVTLNGSTVLGRDPAHPATPAVLAVAGGSVVLGGVIAAADGVSVAASGTLTAGAKAIISTPGPLALSGTTLAFSPGFLIGNAGATTITSRGPAAFTLPGFSGTSLAVFTPGKVTTARVTTTGDFTVNADKLVLTAGVAAGGAVRFAGTINPNGRVNPLTSYVQTLAGDIRSSASVAINTISFAAADRSITTLGAASIVDTGDLSIGSLSAQSGTLTTSGSIAVSHDLVVNGGALALIAGSDVVTGTYTKISGLLALNAGRNISLGGPVYVGAGSGSNAGSAELQLIAANQVRAAGTAGISGTTAISRVTINAGSVLFDPTATIGNANVDIVSRGATTLGDILANSALAQTVSVQSVLGLSTGRVTGATVRLASTAGVLTAHGPISGGAITLDGTGGVTTGGLAAQSATITSRAGPVFLGGTTTISLPATPAAARLVVTAATRITIGGRISADGGVALTAPAIVTTASGVFADTGKTGAPFTLRGDIIDVAFDAGTGTAAPVRIDARGLMASQIASATFHFTGTRAVAFDYLWAARSSLYANQPLTASNLQLRDWLRLQQGTKSILLTGSSAPAPATDRSIVTGALTGAMLQTVPGTGGGSPLIRLDGVSR